MKQLLMGLLLLVSSQSFAGPRIVGNGGVGVNLNGHLYMLDLYERGIQENAYYAPDVKSFKWVSDDLTNNFGMTNLPNVPLEKLSNKVNELLQKRYLTGVLLYEALMRLDWRLVADDLEPLDDVKTPLMGLTLQQVAVRQDNVVFINSQLWNQLNEDNKVALLIHEAFYFAGAPEEIRNGDISYRQQNASQARSITGLLFTKRFSVEGLTSSNSTFKPFIDNTLPSLFRNSRNIYSMDISVDLVAPLEGDAYSGVGLIQARFDMKSYKSRGEFAAKMSNWALLACKQNLRVGSKGKSERWNLIVYYSFWDITPAIKAHARKNGERQSHLEFTDSLSYSKDFEPGFEWNDYKTNEQCAEALKTLLNKQMSKHVGYRD